MAEQTTLEVKTDETLVKVNNIKQINIEIGNIDEMIHRLTNYDLIIATGNYPRLTYHYLTERLKSEIKLKVIDYYKDKRDSCIKEAEALMK